MFEKFFEVHNHNPVVNSLISKKNKDALNVFLAVYRTQAINHNYQVAAWAQKIRDQKTFLGCSIFKFWFGVNNNFTNHENFPRIFESFYMVML